MLWRLVQFRLRTLLIAMALLGVWLGVQVKRAQDERRSADAIRALGATIAYEHTFGDDEKLPGGVPAGPAWLRRFVGDDLLRSVVRVNWNGAQIDSGDFQRLTSFRRLRRLNLDHSQFDDACLVHIAALAELESLSLNMTPVSDAGLAHVSGLTQLKELGLSETNVTDAGLVYLKGLQQLNGLTLGDTDVGDAGLAHVSKLTNLETLILSDTVITDAGAVHLQSLRDLKILGLSRTSVGDDGALGLSNLKKMWWLHLNGSQVTAQGVVALRQALPKCEIEFDKFELQGLRISKAAWRQLALRLSKLDGLGRVKFLNLAGTTLSDDELRDLESLSDRVQLIDVRDTQVTTAGVSRLEQALPLCEIRR